MAQAATPAPAAGDFAGLVDIGGRSLYLECRGAGSPTVVLEAGYRSPATVWTDDLLQPESPREMVLPGLANQTRVCAYERPGVAALLDDGLQPSRSDPVPMPRTAESVVADLHALLTAASEFGPYVLVGHSLGGLVVRLFAATYPAEVAGLVLVDAWFEELEMLLTSEEWAAYVALNSVVPPELADYPELETIDFAAASTTMRRAAAATPLARIPLAVVSKGQPFGMPAEVLGFDPAALESAWVAAQDGLAALLPDARHLTATESSHYVQLEQPDLVIAAIGQVVEAVRDPRTWAT
jgi:pimeloyl-ACP methyl ester carboxylesterase